MCKVRYNTLNHETDGLQQQWVPLLSAKIQDYKATVETGSLRLDSYRLQKVRAMCFSRFNILRCFSAYNVCTEWLFELL